MRAKASALLALLIIALTGCVAQDPDYSFTIENTFNYDAKFYDMYCITSIGSHPQIYDLNGNHIKTVDTVITHWIESIPEKDLFLYGNGYNEAGLCIFDSDFSIKEKRVLFDDDLLKIDPSACFYKGYYYFTYTYIDGPVNNKDPKGENGIYNVMLYKTRDFTEIEELGSIITERHNIEDTEFAEFSDGLRFFYEKEDYDKGPSKICMITLGNDTIVPGEETVLIDVAADNEPAKVIVNPDDSFSIYVSSDLSNPGESYEGSNVFRYNFNSSGEIVSVAPIKMPVEKGILLYDILTFRNKQTYLFTSFHDKTTDLVLHTISN